MTANFRSDATRTSLNYKVIREAITQIRTQNKSLLADWKAKIDADYRSRGGIR